MTPRTRTTSSCGASERREPRDLLEVRHGPALVEIGRRRCIETQVHPSILVPDSLVWIQDSLQGLGAQLKHQLAKCAHDVQVEGDHGVEPRDCYRDK